LGFELKSLKRKIEKKDKINFNISAIHSTQQKTYLNRWIIQNFVGNYQ